MATRTKRKTTVPAAKRTKSTTRGRSGPSLFRIIVHVKDLAKATQFYSRLLATEGRAVGGGRVYFDCGPVILALLDPSGGSRPRPLPDFVYFAVGDLEAVHARASELDCLDESDVHGEPAGEIVTRPWGERSFYTQDPWGNGLCFVAETTKFTG